MQQVQNNYVWLLKINNSFENLDRCEMCSVTYNLASTAEILRYIMANKQKEWKQSMEVSSGVLFHVTNIHDEDLIQNETLTIFSCHW